MAAARPTRQSSTVKGGSAVSATFWKKNDPPQSTLSRSSSVHSAALIRFIESGIRAAAARRVERRPRVSTESPCRPHLAIPVRVILGRHQALCVNDATRKAT